VRLRYLFSVILAIVLSPFLIFWAWSAIESARLERIFDALEARREPLDFAAFDPKPANDEQRQASHYYKQAAGLVADLRPRWLTETGRLIEDFCGTSDPVTRKGREASLKSFEDRYRRALDLLDRATALDANGWDPADKPSSSSIESNYPFELAGVNAVRVARLACSGNGGEAAHALLASLRLRRLMFRWVGLRLGIQTGHSVQLVLRAGAPPMALETLQREYERIDGEPGLDAGLQQARAQWLYFALPGVFSDAPSGFETLRMTPFQAIGMRLLRPARDHAAIVQLRQFDEAISAAKQPWPRPLDEAARLDRTFPRTSNRGSLVSTVVGGVGRNVANGQLQFYANSVAETLARTNASIGALAIARWRTDHGGAVPASLRDLGPKYVSVPLVDPYSGGELKYIADAQGYRVYSVGSNRQDDGGVWEQRSDLQVSRRGDPLDVGIAVRESPKSP
jgi:hypothetical protein